MPVGNMGTSVMICIWFFAKTSEIFIIFVYLMLLDTPYFSV